MASETLELHGTRWELRHVTGPVTGAGSNGSVFIRTSEGREHPVEAELLQLAAREGHVVTVTTLAAPGGGEGWLLSALNHDTGEISIVNEVVQNRLCGGDAMNRRWRRRLLWGAVLVGAWFGYRSDPRFPMGGAVLGALTGLLFGWLAGMIIAGLFAAKTSHDRMQAFVKGQGAADLRARMAAQRA